MLSGTAKSALDVLAGVTSKYLLNVGWTVALLSDRFAHNMTPEVRVSSNIITVLMSTMITGNHSSYFV
jgi:hypothetical protein